MEQFQDLKEYLRRTKGSRYPLDGHWLAEQENFLKNYWCKMLCMLLQAGKSVSEEQRLFLQRLIAGVEAEYDTQTYMRQGLEVKPEELEEFITTLMGGDEEQTDLKRYVFILDALLLLHLGEEDENAQELLAQLCEAFRFSVEKLAPLVTLCVDILKQDILAAVLDARNMGEKYFECLWQPYLPKWEGTKTYNTEDSIAQIASERAPLVTSVGAEIRKFSQNLPIGKGRFEDVEGMFFQDKSTVCLYNLDIHLNWHLCFSNVQKVLLIDCKFAGNEDQCVWFFHCEDVMIHNCSFENIKGRMIYAIESRNIRISNTNFLKSKVYYSEKSSNWKELGGVIYGTLRDMQLFLQDSQFMNCIWANSEYYQRSSVISNCPAVIKSCRFENCWHYHYDNHGSTNQKDFDNPHRCLFSHILSESDNELIDSAELGPH